MICSSCPEHAPTVPHRSQTASRPRRPSSNAAPQHRARAPRASATACASNAPRRRTRCSAPRRTQRACPSSRSRGSTRGWRSTRSRSVQRGYSLRTSSRDVSVSEAAAVVLVRGWTKIGTSIARLRTSEWKSGHRETGASACCALFLRIFLDPLGIGLCIHARCVLSLSRLHGAEPDRATWQAAHKAFVQAFVEPPDAAWQKKLAKVLKRPPPKEVADALFTYDGFLHGLGRMSLSAWSSIVVIIINNASAYKIWHDRSRGARGIVHVSFPSQS